MRVAIPASGEPGTPYVLVHGAANSSKVWTLWQQELAAVGSPSWAPDLRGHGDSPCSDLSEVSMADYEADVQSIIRQIGRPPVLVGWSMGGLVAMMVAASGVASACVTLAPSRGPRPWICSVNANLDGMENRLLPGGAFSAPAMPIAGAGR